jgi:hypothetical protein
VRLGQSLWNGFAKRQQREHFMPGTLKARLEATNERINSLKDARKAANKIKRKEIKQTQADRERKKLLVGEAVLERVAKGQWDEKEFLRMMNESLFRPSDRRLFDLEDDA